MWYYKKRSAQYKHISVTLILCNRMSLDKLDIISQTDIECQWSTQKHKTRETYKAVPVNNKPCFHSNSNKIVIVVDPEKIRRDMIDNLPSSALAMHSIGRRTKKILWRMIPVCITLPY